MKTQHIFLILLPLLALACSVEDTTPSPPSMVQPGTSTRELGSMRFGDAFKVAQGDATTPSEGARTETTPCYMAMNAGSVAILEFKEGAYSVEQTESCDGPFSATVLIRPMHTLAVVAGDALPPDLEVVFPGGWFLGGDYYPQTGDTWLITVRPAREHWVLTTYVPLSFGADGSVQSSAGALYPPVNFPESFEGLVETFEPLVDDLTNQCPEEAQERDSEELWDRTVFDPTLVGCHGSDPSDFEEPANTP